MENEFENQTSPESSEITEDYYDVSTENKNEIPKKSGKKGKVLKKAGALVLSGVLFGAVAGGTLYGTNYLLEKNNQPPASVSEDGNRNNSNENNKENTSGTDNKLTLSDSYATGGDASMLIQTGDNLTVSQIAENCMPSIVAITNLGVSEIQTMWGTYQQESESCGSGVIIGESDAELIILTNYHVVSGSKELTVVFSFDENEEEPDAVRAEVKGYDSERDIAVIAIDLNDIDDETLSSIKIAVIGNSDNIKLGEQVVAIGNALGYGQSVTTGIISAIDRLVSLEGSDGSTITNEYIQTDAAINPGNSGGALFNMKGELIGINSAKVSNSSVEGMGYAIPISDIYDLVNELMNKEVRKSLPEEDQGYLCISGQDVPQEATQLYGVPAGAYVLAVYENYAAAEAGIMEGDIITEINGVEISSMTELKKELSYYEGGAEISIVLMRQNVRNGYEEIEVTVVLNDYDDFNKLKEEQ
ncbi:MAG: S1C family serine protease [Lachnospiraceae bacterium]